MHTTDPAAELDALLASLTNLIGACSIQLRIRDHRWTTGRPSATASGFALSVPIDGIGEVVATGTTPFVDAAAGHLRCFARHVGSLAALLVETDVPTLDEETRRFQRRYITHVLALRRGNVTRAARDLGVARSYLYVLMQTLELRRTG